MIGFVVAVSFKVGNSTWGRDKIDKLIKGCYCPMNLSAGKRERGKVDQRIGTHISF